MTSPIAFVLHANQFVITDGYLDRDGISTTAAGYDAVLSLHVELQIPVSLHISGPVLESLAWHRPALLSRLREHLASGWVTLIGGTYGENIMPLASPRHNRRQLRAFHEIAEDLLGVPRHLLKTAWVPERVWSTETCAAPLRDIEATGVRYERVLIDDRLAHRLDDGHYPDSPRAAFDAAGPYRWHAEGFPSSVAGRTHLEGLQPYEISGGDGLVAVPITSYLRYLVPPHELEHLDLLNEIAKDVENAPPGSLLVFADDLERVAGVAGWEDGLERYTAFLHWLNSSGSLRPVGLDAWCDEGQTGPEQHVDAGTYYELAHDHGSGEHYERWAFDPRWQPFAERLDRVEAALNQAEEDHADPALCALAERLVMLGRHETAWQDPSSDGGRAPAPWVRATAAHAADALPVLAAARWASEPRPLGLRVLFADVDEDGDEEIIMCNDHLFAVFTPRHGGRLSLLVSRGTGPGGQAVVVVGNPADHWNFQAELHQYMEQPSNHPGGLTVRGTGNHAYATGRIEITADQALVELLDTEGGPDHGLSKQIVLCADSAALVVCLQRRGLPGELRTSVALSPDYGSLLLNERDLMTHTEGTSWWGASSPTVDAWVAHDPAEGTTMLVDTSAATGHSRVGAVDGAGWHQHLVIGSGPIEDSTGPALISGANDILHPLADTGGHLGEDPQRAGASSPLSPSSITPRSMTPAELRAELGGTTPRKAGGVYA